MLKVADVFFKIRHLVDFVHFLKYEFHILSGIKDSKYYDDIIYNHIYLWISTISST